MDNPQLDPNYILEAEFEYIATTATQSNEDRGRVTSFFFVTVGSLIAAILGARYFDEASGYTGYIFLGFSLLFMILTILGYLTTAQLARLRTAWFESVHAMNVLKEYYVKEIGGNLNDAFLWKKNTIPAPYKPGSVANFLAQEVTILSGLIFGAGVYFFLLGLGVENGIEAIIIGLAFGILMWQIQFYLYKRLLDSHELSNRKKA